jgi:hypothetical protein
MTRARPVAARAPFPVARPADAAPQDWPYYLDRHQRAWLDRLRDAWGDDAVVQIWGGRVRIQDDTGDWLFDSEADLQATIVRRRRESPG